MICPFCRTPGPASEPELVKRLKKRAEGDDASALNILGCSYYYGRKGLLQDCNKGIELLLRAGELGNARAYGNIGYAYDNGQGVGGNTKKANHYYELGAMRGDVNARTI